MTDAILVIGAGGFIGRHLVRALAQQGDRVIAASRSAIDFRLAHVETHVGELREPEDFLPLVARCRAVVHLASTTTPGSSSGRPLTELQENLTPTLALLQALQSRPGTRLLYLSSGGSLYATGASELANEHARVSPRSYHGAGKAAAEHFIAAWCAQHSTAATLLRPSNIYGPGQTERAGFAIVPTAFGKILRNEALTVWGDGSAIRDYLYIEDFVALCVAVLTAPMIAGAHTINAASGIGVDLNELFRAMEAVTGRALRRNYETDRIVDAKRVVMDASLARQKYGWSPMTSLQDGLERTWRWLTTTQR